MSIHRRPFVRFFLAALLVIATVTLSARGQEDPELEPATGQQVPEPEESEFEVVPEEYEQLTHSCIHDDILEEFGNHHEVRQDYHESYNNSKRADAWSPIRISVDTHDLTLPADKATYLSTKLIPAALSWISAALKVKPVSGNLYLSSASRTCGQASIPTSHTRGQLGIANADFVLYLTSKPTAAGVLAYASACQLDQSGRPIAGNANFGPDNIVPSAVGTYKFDFQLGAVIHELFHALGFSASLFPRYKDANGQTYNPAVKQFTERGRTVSKLVTPTVMQVAAQHFNCPSLNGAEIEDQGGTGTGGSHWEKRIFMQEFMTGMLISGDHTAKSALTLAALADSGWYQVNYNAADTLHWGKGQTCSFAMDKCLNGNPPAAAAPTHFCSVARKQGCTAGRYAKAKCSISRYSSDLESSARYFPNDAKMGGSITFTDYCPVFLPYNQATNKGSSCRYAENLPATNYWGENYGPDSRCFESTLVSSSFTRYQNNPGSGCHTYRCKDGQLQIKVDTRWLACPAAGGTVSVPGYRGTFTCPRFAEMCPSA